MTNEQLLIFIRSWRIRLQKEYDAIDASLPAEFNRTTETVYKGKSLIPILDNDPSNWVDEPRDAIVLEGLKDLIQELEEAEESLKVNETEAEIMDRLKREQAKKRSL